MWSVWEEIVYDDIEVGVFGYYIVWFFGIGVIVEFIVIICMGVGWFCYFCNGWLVLFYVCFGVLLVGNYVVIL